MSSGKDHQLRPEDIQKHTKPAPRHWLDVATFVFVVGAAIAAGFAAWYTRHQWLTAADTENRQLRAYVSLRDILIEKQNDSTFDIIPQWENTGETQTKNMSAYVNRSMAEGELSRGFTFVRIPGNRTVPILLGPRTVATVSFTTLDKSCFTQFNARDILRKFYIWGWARYDDVMTTEPHITRFCWDMNQVVFSEDGRRARLSHGLCDEGNCTEQNPDCMEPKGQITVQFKDTICKPSP
jgi:hypothetical protein